ncbi:MAG: cyclic nucleotide-binding domain-containing protein [Myxococcales bacterium]|nr:cyclic nucleotide-binding domain-containing protein [Myxococcales bacterium]
MTDETRALLLRYLERSPLTQNVPRANVETMQRYLEICNVEAGEAVVTEGETTRSMYLVLDGEARVVRNGVHLGRLTPGLHFGELGLITDRPRAASVLAITPMILARLTVDGFQRMSQHHPHLALYLMHVLVGTLGHELTDMTDNLGMLMRQNFLPRRTEVRVRINGGEEQWVKTGTPISELVPKHVDGRLVVAGLLHRKAVSLSTRILTETRLSTLTTGHFEGFRIYRHSLGLLLIEAASRLAPPIELRLGPSIGFAQLVEVRDPENRPLHEVAKEISGHMRAICQQGQPFTLERWSVDEAIELFRDQKWDGAADLLGSWREGTVSLSTCGNTYVLSMSPLVPDASIFHGWYLSVQHDMLLLFFGNPDRPEQETDLTMLNLARDHQYATVEKTKLAGRANEQWMRALGVDSVGAFNRRCIAGDVTQIIQTAEGFHEKRISQIADEIAGRKRVRVITIAGPSSSGKTTFIKRLKVQLHVNGLLPREISLDNYYVDREKTVKDERGEYDFEALEALDLPLMHDQLMRLLRRERVTLARYDFPSGTSLPEAGPEVQFEENAIMMIEGIHGLNPRILPAGVRSDEVFRIYVNPMTSLSFDRLTRVHVSDLRLLRRIIRDRRHRAISAADNIHRWASVRHGERKNIYPFLSQADVVFDSSLIYELSVIKVYADRYLLEVPRHHPSFTTAFRLRQLVERFVTIYPDHVPPTSIIREFIGGSGFEY